MELWCHAVDTLLAKGCSFAEALDGANVILQAHKRQNTGDQDDAGAYVSEQPTSSREPEDQLMVSMRRTGMG